MTPNDIATITEHLAEISDKVSIVEGICVFILCFGAGWLIAKFLS